MSTSVTRLRILLLFILAPIFFNTLKAQVILQESFEVSFPPSGWVITNAGTGNNWVQDIGQAKSGTYSLACYNNDNNAANAWAFTPSFNLTSGYVYRISYWYKLNSQYAGSKFKITIGNNATPASQTTTIHDYPSVTGSNYTESVDYFTAPASGNFNFAFNCYASSGYYAYALEIDSIVIKQMPKCSGVPSTGTAVASSPLICNGDSSIVSLNGNYNFYGLSFQWQVSPKGLNSFIDIPNATDTFIKVAPFISSDYRCFINCSLSGLNNTSNIATVNIDPTCYCHLPAANCQYSFISNVTYAGINNNSVCSAQGFTYYAAVSPATIYPATTMPISVSVNPGSFNSIGVWIDFDKNGRFDSTEFTYLGGNNGNAGGIISGSVSVPANAVLGVTRMRIRERYAGAFNKTDACASASDMTETEEYNVNITSLTPCTVTPTGGTTTSSATSICQTANFTLSVTGSGISGIIASYQWQSSLNNSTWTDIAGATSATLITQQTVETYYRRKIICNNSLFAYSSSFLQTLSPFASCYCIPSAAACGGITITSVQFGSINNTSACGPYSNYTGTVPAAAVNAGSFVPITVSFTANAVFYGTGYVKGWIDFNQNGIFENAESFNIASSGANATGSFLIRIPFDAKGGVTRMRIKIETGGFDQIDPCVPRSSGETEDYALNITPSPTPTKQFAVYVNKIATGANNGTSWANALTNLSTAFAIVKEKDTIKVAKGTYTPGYSLTDGVNYLGGYPNTGNPTDADRNFSLNTTILTGQEIVGFNLHNTTMLNGFVFENLATSAGYMAALRFEYADPVITNCIFRNNQYRVLYLYASSPSISNCFFLSNTDNYLNKGQIQLLNNSNPKIFNCVFNKNISTSLINVSGSTVKVSNCTFINNYVMYFNIGTIVTQAEIITAANSTAAVSNTIFSDYWYSAANNNYTKLTDSSNVFSDNTSVTNFSNCISTYNQSGTNLIRMVNPKFKDSTNAAGADNLFFTADDGLQLINPCSAAMNSGLNTSVETTADIIGNPRIVSTAVDMGAYEVQSNPAPIPGTVYVNALATGNKDGTSWVNAFTNLQSAFAYCSDTIKVAAGTYYPSATDQQAFFEMQNKRVIWGGYPNTGNPGNSQRNPAANPTILSGNLSGSGNLQSDNIVQAVLVDSTAALNGFIIEGAKAGAVYISYTSNPVIQNCTLKSNFPASFVYKQSKPFFTKCTFSNNDGGIIINNASPVIDSCSFIKNYGGSGSAIANSNRSLTIIKNSSFSGNNNVISGGDIYNNNSDPQITNCVSDSAFSYFGAAIANYNNSKPVITKSIFSNGQTPVYASVTGGAVCYNNNSSPIFINCSFINSKGAGGAFYNSASTVKLINCLGYGNRAAGQRSTSFMQNWAGSKVDIINSTIIKNRDGVEVFANNDNSILNIKNSILWANNFNYGEDIYYNIVLNDYNKEVTNNSASVTTVSNSMTRIYGTNGANGNMVAVDPRFININNPAGADGIFGTADDGLQLCSCSPAINAGVNSSNTTTTDIAGNPRVVNSTIDMGALEYQSAVLTTSKITFVNAGASGLHDGTSWTNAYTSLHDAISNPCADTIKIMQGVYKPALVNRDSSFVIDRKLLLLGGYQNTAAPAEADRNPDNYPTVLSGEIGNTSDSSDNSQIILTINNTDTLVKVDGLTFTHCFSNKMIGASYLFNVGSVYSLNNKNLILKNCRFTDNATALTTSSLFSDLSSLELANCVFSKNHSKSGYQLAGNVMRVGNAKIKNCVFENNYNGDGVTVYETDNADFTNCLFYNNFASTGAGVYNAGVSTFVNCNFIENKGTSYGAGINNTNNHRAFLLNCIFNGNYTGNGYYPDWYDIRGVPFAGTQYISDEKYFAIKNCVTQSSFPNQASVTSPGLEKFVDINNPIGPDNKWFTADDGFKLLPCSPLIDKGIIFTGVVLESRNLVIPVTDILDSQRISGAAIDVGAYEYPGYFRPVISIKATDSVICNGSPVTFTATATGAGTNPVYQWQLNGVNTGTNSNIFTASLLNNNDKIRVIVSSSDPCIAGSVDTSNTITMSVNASLTPSVSISTGSTAICQGTLSTFTAIPVNGGANPAYQWQVNGNNAGNNSNTFSSTALNNNAQIKVIVTSSVSCASPTSVSSNIITMTVNPVPLANAGNDVSICAGSAAQLNGSGGNVYLWSPASGLSNPAIANPVANPLVTTAYILSVSNSGGCTAKDTVIVNVNLPVQPSVTISTASNFVCAGNAVTFTAAATNGGNNPGYQWQVNNINSGTNSNLFTSSVLNNNDQVKLVLTSNASCVTGTTAISNSIIVNVQQLATPIITASNRVYTVTNPDASATYSWQINTNGVWNDLVPAATGITYTASAGGEYRVKAVKGGCTMYSVSLTTNTRTPANNPFGIYLYPNPTNKIITLDSIKLSQNWETLDITNAEGKHVLPTSNIKNQNSFSIDVSALRAGIYFALLRKKDGEYTTLKFVKL